MARCARLALLASNAWLLAAAPADEPRAGLRRVFVPSDRIAELGAVFPELQSVPRERFEQLARQLDLPPGSPALPYVVSSHYEASVADDRLDGAAELVVRGDPERSTLLRWPLSRWSVTAAGWESGDAIVGTVGLNDFAVVVPPGNSHRLRFNWSAPLRNEGMGRHLELQLPRSAWGEMLLDLPRGLSLVPAPRRTPVASNDASQQRWRIALDPSGTLRRVIVQPGDAVPLRALITYDRELDADIAEEGTELVARFNLVVAHQPIDRLELICANELELYGWSGIQLHDWRVRDGRVQLDLAEPLFGVARVSVRALAAGPRDGSWSLPRMEIADAFWTGGRTQLRTAAELRGYDPQISQGGLVAVQSDETGRPVIVIDHYAADSAASLRVSRGTPPVFAKVHTRVGLGDRLKATAAIEWRVGFGEVTELPLQVPDGWSIETWETVPQAVLVPSGVDSGAQIATLRLLKPLAAGAPGSARIQLTGPELPGDGSFETAVPRVRPMDVHASDEIISLERLQSWSVELIDSHQLSPIAHPVPESPEAAEPAAATATHYRFDTTESRGRLRIGPLPPEQIAHIDVLANADRQWIKVQYSIEIESGTTAPGAVELHMSQPTGGQLEWNLPARAWVEPSTPPGDSPGEVWRIELPGEERRSRISATWQVRTDPETIIPIPSVTGAAATIGRLTVVLPSDENPEFRLEKLVPARPTVDRRTTALAAASVRQRVWQFGNGTPSCAILWQTPSPDALRATYASQAQWTTSLGADGAAVHCFRYHIRGTAARDVQIELPPGAQLRRASSTSAEIEQLGPTTLRVRCPGGEPNCQVLVQYASSGPPPANWSSLKFELPRLSIPCHSLSWRVEPPPGFAACTATDDLIAVPPHSNRGWTERLFGSLARTSGAALLRFWDSGTWQQWWQTTRGTARDDGDERVVQSLERFRRDVPARERSWLRLFSQLDQLSNRRLVVDSLALKESALDLNESPHSNPAAANDSFFGLAQDAGFVLLKTRHGLLLTTAREKPFLATNRTAAGLCWMDHRRGLGDAVDAALLHGSDSSGRFLIWSRWVQGADVAATPQPDDMPPPGAGTARFESFSSPQAVSIDLIDCSAVRHVSSAIVCLALICAVMPRKRPGRAVVVLSSAVAGASCAAALVVPGPLSTPAAVLAWSQLATLLFWLRLPSEPLRPAADEVPHAFTAALRRLGQAGACLLATVLICPRAGTAQEQPPLPPTPPEPIVFIPYDPAHPEKRHEYSRVLVPRALYDRWLEQPAADPNFVLIRSAALAGRFGSDRFEFTVDVDLHSLAPGAARAVVPLAGAFIRTAQLDEKPCVIEAGPAGLSVELPGSGRHRLRLDCVLALEPTATEGWIDVRIPTTPQTAIELDFPATVAFDLDAPGTAPRWTRGPDRQQLRTALGGAERLRGRWRKGPPNPARVRAETATLVLGNQTATTLECRANVVVESGIVQQLVFDADSRLRLLRLRAPGLSSFGARPGEPTRIVLQFEQPLEKPTPVVMEFLVSDAIQHGRFAVPRVLLAGANPATSLLAIAGDRRPAWRVAEPAEPARASVEDLQRVWDEPLDRAIGSVVHWPAGPAPLVLEALPWHDAAALSYRAELRVQPHRVELLTQLGREPTESAAFYHEFALPAHYELSGVRAAPGTSWFQPARDRIAWFGSPTQRESVMIELTGFVTLAGSEVALPLILPRDSSTLSGELTLWRRRDIRLSITDTRSLELAELRAESQNSTPSLVPDSAYRVIGRDVAATLRLEPLTPRVAATVATRLLVDQPAAEWISVVDFQVEHGFLQEFELLVPDGFRPPLQIAGEGILERQVRRDAAHQVWTVRLQQPQWNNYRLVLRAPIEPAGEDSIVLRMIVPRHVSELRSYLLVLNATDDEVALRDTTQLSTVPSDEFQKWFSDPITKNVVGAFECNDPSLPIEVHRPARVPASREAAVLVERHRCWLQAAGPSVFASWLWVRARSDTPLPLQLPAAAVVLDATVDGQRVTVANRPDGRRWVPVDAHDRPREVQIWWTLEVPATGQGSAAETSELRRLGDGDGPILWSVFSSRALQVASRALSPTSRSMQEVRFARAVADELKRAVESSKASDSASRQAVLRDLQLAFLRSSELCQRVLDAERDQRPSWSSARREHVRAAQVLERLLQQNRDLLERSGLTSLPARIDSSAWSGDGSIWAADRVPAPSRRAAQEPVQRHARTEPAYFVTEGENLSLRLPRDPGAQWLTVPSLLLALGVAGSGVWFGITRQRGMAAVLWLATLGTIWIGWLRPEPIGPALWVAALLVLLWQIRWRRGSAIESPAAAVRT